MRIVHIYHSGMLVELAETVLVFDWWQGELPAFDRSKRVVCFASHVHHDHYDERIWSLTETCPRVSYVLDSGISAGTAARGRDVLSAEPYHDYLLDGLRVRTARSNDEGVAFLVEVEGHSIFHSGDLNVWWWDRELALNEASDAWFRRELEQLGVRDVDVAFVPLDTRLADPARGIVAFMEVAGAQLVVPMHYWDDRAGAMAQLERAELAPYRSRICFDDEIQTGWRVVE